MEQSLFLLCICQRLLLLLTCELGPGSFMNSAVQLALCLLSTGAVELSVGCIPFLKVSSWGTTDSTHQYGPRWQVLQGITAGPTVCVSMADES